MRIRYSFLALLLFYLTTTARADDSAALVNQRAIVAAKLSDVLDVEFTSVSGDVLQAVGQAVLEKAVRAGWAELESKLSKLAGCAKTPKPLPKTCEALGHTRIQDLIASPRVLLDAFLADLLPKLRNAVSELPDGAKATVSGLAIAWTAFGSDAINTQIKPWLKAQIKERASEVACPKDKAKAVAWVLATCALTDVGKAVNQLETCDFDTKLTACTLTPDEKAQVRDVAQLVSATLSAATNDTKAVPPLMVQAFFEWTKLSASAAQKSLLEGFKQVFLGLTQRDWTRTIIGIGHVASNINAAKCDEDKHKCTIGMKLVRIVGAIGQFAETYSTKGGTDATAAREKVIADLVSSLVNRTERDHGVVVSLGGALGGFLGTRFDKDNYQAAMPVRLTLGLGFQSYHAGTGGFHASLDAFDLGQYVTYSSNDLEVAAPDTRSSLIVGATIGGWFRNRETPIFVAFHGSISPFVRTTEGKMTFEAGVLFGIYVPLLDFN